MSSYPAITVAESATLIPGQLPSHRISLRNKAKRLSQATFDQSTRAIYASKALGLSIVSSAWVLLICKAIIGVVSAFDTYLTIKYAVSLDVYEQNPLGRWLMGLDQGPVAETQQIAAFITAKFLGTLAVMIAIQGLAYWRMKVAGLVALPLALGQLYLAMHLVYGQG